MTPACQRTTLLYSIVLHLCGCYNYDSTAVRLLIRGHLGHSDVTHVAVDQLAAVTLTCLFSDRYRTIYFGIERYM